MAKNGRNEKPLGNRFHPRLIYKYHSNNPNNCTAGTYTQCHHLLATYMVVTELVKRDLLLLSSY